MKPSRTSASSTVRLSSGRSLTFNLPLYPRQLAQWRGAFIEMAGRENELFHNHKGEKEEYHTIARIKTKAMKQTDLFFSPVIDLQHHTLPAHIMDALRAVYSACRAINQPRKYGPAIELIIIDAVHQDCA